MNLQNARFWFSWLGDVSGNQGLAEEQALRQALQNVIHLLCREPENTEATSGKPVFLPFASLHTLPEAAKYLIDYMDDNSDLEVCWVYGILDSKSAQLASIEQLGIDLFSIPANWPPGSFPTGPCFRYVCVASLTSVLEEVFKKQHPYSIDFHDQEGIKLQLQAACCHAWLSRSRSRVAHGNRDRIQSEAPEIILSALEKAKNDFPSVNHRVCQDGCSAIAALDVGIECLSHTPSEVTKHAVAKDLANLDCQTPRLASLLHTRSAENTDLPFDQIVVFEDNENMRNHIVDLLRKMTTCECHIISADPIASYRKRALVADDGKTIGYGDSENRHEMPDASRDVLRTLLCFDLEVCDPKSPNKRLDICGVSSGLWFLYKCAHEYPLASRLVITGHRRLDERGLNAGAGDLLLKPFTDDDLMTAIRSASRHSMLWVSPESVRQEWVASFSRIADETVWESDPLKILKAWLFDCNLRLDFRDALSFDVDSDYYDLVILDPYPWEGRDSHKPDLVSEYISCIRRWPIQPRIIVLLPYERRALQAAGVLHLLGRLLRDGQDKIIHKPISVTEDNDPQSMGPVIINALASVPAFDVKYVAITPLMGLVWAKTRNLFSRAVKGKDVDIKYQDFAWAPMAVLVGEMCGFSSRPGDIVAEIRSNENLREEVATRLQDEIDRNEKRWKMLGVTANDVLDAFLDSVNEAGPIMGLRSLESWLMRVVDTSTGGVRTRSSFEDDLVKLFGGETRLSIGAKGGWFDDGGAYVTDVPLIIEFCAKRGIIAREAIEKVVVEYLTKDGCEARVLIQEIPIRGYMLSGSS